MSHATCIVTFDYDGADPAGYVYEYLESNSFAGDARYGIYPADYFTVVGVDIITGELYDKYLEEYEGAVDVYDVYKYEFSDVDHDAVSRDFIGRKYLAVIDYHC